MPERKDLHQLARSTGFSTERDMLWSLYIEKKFSIRDISAQTGLAYDSIHRRLTAMSIPIRKKKKGKK